jgi:hypothetical protein
MEWIVGLYAHRALDLPAILESFSAQQKRTRLELELDVGTTELSCDHKIIYSRRECDEYCSVQQDGHVLMHWEFNSR